MRVWPVVGGCAMIAFGLFAWLGASLTGSAGAASASDALGDALLGLPGVLLLGGVVLLLWGFTDKDARKK